MVRDKGYLQRCLLTKPPKATATVHRRRLWPSRAAKRASLKAPTTYERLWMPASPRSLPLLGICRTPPSYEPISSSAEPAVAQQLAVWMCRHIILLLASSYRILFSCSKRSSFVNLSHRSVKLERSTKGAFTSKETSKNSIKHQRSTS